MRFIVLYSLLCRLQRKLFYKKKLPYCNRKSCWFEFRGQGSYWDHDNGHKASVQIFIMYFKQSVRKEV